MPKIIRHCHAFFFTKINIVVKKRTNVQFIEVWRESPNKYIKKSVNNKTAILLHEEILIIWKTVNKNEYKHFGQNYLVWYSQLYRFSPRLKIYRSTIALEISITLIDNKHIFRFTQRTRIATRLDVWFNLTNKAIFYIKSWIEWRGLNLIGKCLVAVDTYIV